MSSKRAQGRPARGADQVGRDRIIEGMRAALRARPHAEITRNEIAEYAGVTPALVTYYFPDRENLIVAASGPVVAVHAECVHAISDSIGSNDERLLSLIELLVQCHIRDAHLLDAFSSHVSQRRASSCPDHLATMVQGCANVVNDWLETSPSCPYDAEFLNDAMWGLCEFLARKSARTNCAEQMRKSSRQAKLIFALLAGGSSDHAREGRARKPPADDATGFDTLPPMIRRTPSMLSVDRKRAKFAPL